MNIDLWKPMTDYLTATIPNLVYPGNWKVDLVSRSSQRDVVFKFRNLYRYSTNRKGKVYREYEVPITITYTYDYAKGNLVFHKTTACYNTIKSGITREILSDEIKLHLGKLEL